nr:glycosyltransferase [Vibrio alginolyticus]
MPLFSVVIPYYNDSKFIEETLDSLVVQSLNDFEVIIIDDCSQDSDELTRILSMDKYCALDVTLKRNSINMNGSHCRNLGIVLSRGEYICFLDSDDLWREDKLYEVKMALLSNPDVEVLYSQVEFLHDSITTEVRPEKGICGDASEYLFLEGGFIQTSSIVVSRQLALKVKFNDKFKRHQDYDFCLRLSREAKFSFIKKPLVYYRTGGDIYRRRADDLEFCDYWLDNVCTYMSSDGYYGYKVFAYNARLFYAKKYLKVLVNTLSSFGKLSLRGKVKFLKKLKLILFNWLR